MIREIVLFGIFLSASLSYGKPSKGCLQVIADSYFDGDKFILEKTSIIINKGEIQKITPFRMNTCLKVIAAPFVMPALIEPHAHLFLKVQNQFHNFAKVSALSEALSGESRLREAHRNAKNYFRNGFYYVRDLGNHGPNTAIQNWISEDDEPRLTFSGQGISYQTSQLGPKSQEYKIYQSTEDFLKNPPAIFPNQKWLKIYLDNDPAEGVMPLNFAKAVIVWAHKKNLKVAAHADIARSYELGSELSIDTLEHGGEISKASNIPLILTDLSHITCLSILKSEPNFDNCEDLKKRKSNRIDKILKNKSLFGIGSDAYFDPTLQRGESALEALRAAFEEGLSSQQVLSGATRDNAIILGLSRQGKIQEGFQANLIGLSTSPQNTIENLRAPNWIYSRSKLNCWLKKCGSHL